MSGEMLLLIGLVEIIPWQKMALKPFLGSGKQNRLCLNGYFLDIEKSDRHSFWSRVRSGRSKRHQGFKGFIITSWRVKLALERGNKKSSSRKDKRECRDIEQCNKLWASANNLGLSELYVKTIQLCIELFLLDKILTSLLCPIST